MRLRYIFPTSPQMIFKGLIVKRTLIQDHKVVKEINKNSLLVSIPFFLPLLIMLVVALVNGQIQFKDFGSGFEDWGAINTLTIVIGFAWMYWIVSIVARVTLDARVATEKYSAEMVANGTNPNATITNQK